MTRFIQKLIRKVFRDDCMGLAGEMAYNLILSLVPLMVFLTSLSGLVGGQREIYPMILDFINRFAPTHATKLLTDTIQAIIHGSSAGLTVLGFLGVIWSASGAGGVVVKSLHRAYGLSRRSFPFWYASLLSILIVLSLGLLLTSASYLILFGNFLLAWADRYFLLPSDMEAWLYGLRWLVVIFGIYMGAAFTYTLILRSKVQRMAWKNSFWGSLFFVFFWLSASWLFSLYVEHMHRFNPVYGALGALIILVTWLYYSSLIFLIGGEITALSKE